LQFYIFLCVTLATALPAAKPGVEFQSDMAQISLDENELTTFETLEGNDQPENVTVLPFDESDLLEEWEFEGLRHDFIDDSAEDKNSSIVPFGDPENRIIDGANAPGGLFDWLVHLFMIGKNMKCALCKEL